MDRRDPVYHCVWGTAGLPLTFSSQASQSSRNTQGSIIVEPSVLSGFPCGRDLPLHSLIMVTTPEALPSTSQLQCSPSAGVGGTGQSQSSAPHPCLCARAHPRRQRSQGSVNVNCFLLSWNSPGGRDRVYSSHTVKYNVAHGYIYGALAMC